MTTIDVHVHIASNDADKGCKVSDELQGLAAWTYMLLFNGIRKRDLEQDFDGTLERKIIGTIDSSELIDRAVLLALDWVYDADGSRNEDASHLVVSNEYVAELARRHPKVLFGASVHPNRGPVAGRDELLRVIDGSPPAALIKWVPNSQIIDPADPAHDWFYDILAANDVPLLCHCGPEYAIPVADEADQLLGDPRKLRRALDLGVTVIVPHAATRFFPTDSDDLDFLDELKEMLDESAANGWSLYADLSALCVLCRVGTIERTLDTLADHRDRLILGSDYPIPVNEIPPVLARDIDVAEYLEILATPNALDKNYKQLLAMDFPNSIGTKAEALLPPRALTWTP